MKSIEDISESKHFQLKELKPGVFAAICGQKGAGIGNAGMIDLGDRLLVFDTFLTPQAAADLLAMTQDLTGRQPDLVINSHYHNDHIWGIPHFFQMNMRFLITLFSSETDGEPGKPKGRG